LAIFYCVKEDGDGIIVGHLLDLLKRPLVRQQKKKRISIIKKEKKRRRRMEGEFKE
jgi:hypothetical protein